MFMKLKKKHFAQNKKIFSNNQFIKTVVKKSGTVLFSTQKSIFSSLRNSYDIHFLVFRHLLNGNLKTHKNITALIQYVFILIVYFNGEINITLPMIY